MTQEQLETLMEWVEALIKREIETAFGRDAMREYIIESDAKDAAIRSMK